MYVGSAYELRNRLGTYFFPSRLLDNRHISNSILKYGHSSFSLVILLDLGTTGTVSNTDILHYEQMQMSLYKPSLNINPVAGSTLGFKHSEESKKLMSEFRKGKPMSEATKKKLSLAFSGKLNPF
jgi:group I intron endonuclease